MANKKTKLLFIIIILLICSGCSVFDHYPFKEDDMIDAVKKSKSLDKDKFINYEVVENNNSKELIAVVFNTDDEKNVGFIDEYGNVIKEPFLCDPNYDYYENLRGSIGVSTYHGDYYQYYKKTNKDTIQIEYYDRHFEKVDLSDEDIRIFEKDFEKHNNSTSKDVQNNIEKKVNDLLKSGYKSLSYDNSLNNDLYNISFLYNEFGYNILLDKSLNLKTRLYFHDTTTKNLFAEPRTNSKVGNFFVKDFGLVYYNLDGDIIWITYCK